MLLLWQTCLLISSIVVYTELKRLHLDPLCAVSLRPRGLHTPRCWLGRHFWHTHQTRENVSGYVCNHGSLRVGNETLRPLGVAMGNAVSVTRVWSIHTKTPPVGRRQPMTSLPARPQYKGAPGKYVIHFFVWSLRPKHGTAPRGRSVSFPTLREPWLHT